MNSDSRSREDGIAARLTALADYRILDTAPERDFDDIAFLASHICDAPVALVSLVERDRQWFKARVGFDQAQTPIGQSVCAHAIQGDGLLIIEDLTQDPRTRDNTLVTEGPEIRFYAGAPLITPQGVAVGALCVIDAAPRHGGLSPAQAEALEGLARQVVAQLELRRRVAESEAETRRSRLAEAAGRIGTFGLDVATGQTVVSPEFCRLFGLDPASSYPVAALEALILDDHPGGRSIAGSRVTGEGSPEVEYRIRRAADGAVRWILRRAEYVREGDEVVAMYGALQDITERREGQRRVDALLALGERLRDCSEPADIGYLAAEALGRNLDAASAAFGAISADGETLTVARAWAVPGAAPLQGDYHMPDFGEFHTELRRGQMLVVDDAFDDPRATRGEEGLAEAGARAFISLPIMDQGRLVAMISVNAAEPRAWNSDEIAFAQAVADLTYSARARVLAEAEQKVLNQEIGHRLKNSLAMVQSIARQTLRGGPPGPVAAFEQRLQALSAAHDLLFRDNWDSADMGAVVERTLHAVADPQRFEITGPPVWLGSRATLALSLVLHELATNAAKYGALGADGGRVAVAWALDGEDLMIEWRERGGPPVSPPAQTGFGSRLIQMGLGGGGQVALRYPVEGFEADLRAPLARLRDA